MLLTFYYNALALNALIPKRSSDKMPLDFQFTAISYNLSEGGRADKNLNFSHHEKSQSHVHSELFSTKGSEVFRANFHRSRDSRPGKGKS